MPPKLAILTGGGDCPGLNAVIRATAKTAILGYGAEIIGFEDGYDGLIHNRFRELDYMAVSGILTLGGTILGTSNRANPLRYPIEEKGEVRFEDVTDKAVANFKASKADALVVIGGDGTISIADALCRRGIPCVGVPKTIDNDLYGTDQTFGFDTARSIATMAVDMLHTTAQAHHRVMVIEVMGRNAGWIALEAGLAGGGDVLLLPEIPYRIEAVRDYLKGRMDAGKRFSIVVVAEGARPVDGDVVIKRRVADGAEPIRLGGVGMKIRDDIEEISGIETRCVVLGHLLRGGSPSACDRVLASRFGRDAAELALQGKHGIMVGLKGQDIVPVPMSEVAGRQRLVDPNCHLVLTARAVGTCMGDY